ncbi:MAG TPA: hypothetical protein VMU89_00195 [Thermomicrobiaceae bacterium]|nr:hypothetical protein [Thermomicrobiaceae bacterium]
MRLDPRLTPTEIRRILQRRAAEAFGPMRANELFDLVGYTTDCLARIAAAPLSLTGEAPDLSGVDAPEGSRPS